MPPTILNEMSHITNKDRETQTEGFQSMSSDRHPSELMEFTHHKPLGRRLSSSGKYHIDSDGVNDASLSSETTATDTSSWPRDLWGGGVSPKYPKGPLLKPSTPTAMRSQGNIHPYRDTGGGPGRIHRFPVTGPLKDPDMAVGGTSRYFLRCSPDR
jgi:hypothetical protein